MSYRSAYAVTPHDTNPSIRSGDVTDALYIGGAGSGALTVVMSDGKTVAFAGVPVGILPIAVSKVLATGTNVTNIVALKF
jgi:hypothetical protein